jgi:hypothetical protein
MEALMRETVRVAIGVTVGVAALVAPIVARIAGIGPNNAQRVLEATVQMERLATDLEHAKKIAPETKVEIAQLTHQPWYDCNQLACRAALEMRNRAARERLQAVLAGSEAPTVFSARRTIGAETTH